MKFCGVLLLCSALSLSAATVQFSLSPPGTDVAVGLSPNNVVPPAPDSTGSGNTISGGIAFDADSRVLEFAFGYGSAAGFTDLTGPAQSIQVRGPAAPGENAASGIDLAPFSFLASDPARGGVVVGQMVLPPELVADLLGGKYYVQINTSTKPNGELRAQVVPAALPNEAPVVRCGSSTNIECGTAVVTEAMVMDPEGDGMLAVWSLNGVAVQTNTIRASMPPVATPLSLTTTPPLGTNVVSLVVADSAGNKASCFTLITVVDTTPPVIAAMAEPRVLWPPNHKMVPIAIRVRTHDACGPVSWRITRVTSDEPVDDLGDGHTTSDWRILGDHGLLLRAERDGRGDGRVYTIFLQGTDESGNRSRTRTITVTVPKSQGRAR